MRLSAAIILGLLVAGLQPAQQLSAHSLYLSVGAGQAKVLVDGAVLGHTDSSGVFYYEPVEAGMHLLRVEKQGCHSRMDTIFVPYGLTCNYTLPLEPLRIIMINELTGREDESVGGPYTFQVGSFRDVENAHRLIAEFEGSAFEMRCETAEVPGVGVMHRVRCSHFNTIAAARAAADGLVRKRNSDVWIVGLNGRDWAVQLAAYDSRDQAARLVAAVTGPDLYAWIEHTPGGKYRVKLGYWTGRAAAEAAAAEWAGRLEIEPMVIQVH